jgi:hypothetical protein
MANEMERERREAKVIRVCPWPTRALHQKNLEKILFDVSRKKDIL